MVRKAMGLRGVVGAGALLAAAWLIAVGAGQRAVAAEEAGSAPVAGGPRLELRSLSVRPRYARPGEVVRIEAVVANVGGESAYDLRLVPAVAAGAGSVRWALVDASSAGPMPLLAAGEETRLGLAVLVEGEGAPKIGAAVVAANAMLLPRGEVVRVATRSSLAVQVGVLAVAFAVIVGGLAALVRATGLPGSAAPAWPVLGGGLAVAGLGVATWAAARPIGEDAAHLGLALFTAGWLALFVGLRPRGRPAWGVPVGAGGYVALGLAWLLIERVGFARLPLGLVLGPDALANVWLWPLDLVQVFGVVQTATPM